MALQPRVLILFQKPKGKDSCAGGCLWFLRDGAARRWADTITPFRGSGSGPSRDRVTVKCPLKKSPGEATGPTGCRLCPLTRRTERFMIRMHSIKVVGALQEPGGRNTLPESAEDFLLLLLLLIEEWRVRVRLRVKVGRIRGS